MHLLFTLVEILASLAICGVGAHFFMQVVLTYQITPSHLRVVLFGLLPVCAIPLCDATVKKMTHRDLITSPDFFRYSTMVNRLFVREFVFIRKRSGFSRYIIISPDNPDEFIIKLIESGATRESCGGPLN